jgi:putative chitinase
MELNVNTLRKLSPKANESIIVALGPHLESELFSAEINTPLRAAHFLAQAAHECDGFRTLEEYATGVGYEFRRDLGNIFSGDGRKFKGRGIFQLTGRANYMKFGDLLGLPLSETPELAADPKISLKIAVLYWKTRKRLKLSLNFWADRDNIIAITKAINGGTNGLRDRRWYLDRAKSILGT